MSERVIDRAERRARETKHLCELAGATLGCGYDVQWGVCTSSHLTALDQIPQRCLLLL